MSGLFPKLINNLDQLAFAKSLESAFGGIYCINLDHRPDRWERASSHFNQFGIKHLVKRQSATFLKNDPLYNKHERLQGGKYLPLQISRSTLGIFFISGQPTIDPYFGSPNIFYKLQKVLMQLTLLLITAAYLTLS